MQSRYFIFAAQLMLFGASLLFGSATAAVNFEGLDDATERNARALVRLASTPCDRPRWRVERLYPQYRVERLGAGDVEYVAPVIFGAFREHFKGAFLSALAGQGYPDIPADLTGIPCYFFRGSDMPSVRLPRNRALPGPATMRASPLRSPRHPAHPTSLGVKRRPCRLLSIQGLVFA